MTTNCLTEKPITELIDFQSFQVEELEERLEMAEWSLFAKSEQSTKTGVSVSGGVRVTF